MFRFVSALFAVAMTSIGLPALAQTGVRISLPICNSKAVPSNFKLYEPDLPDGSWFWDSPNPCGTSLFDCLFAYSVHPTKPGGTFVSDTMSWGGGNDANYVQYEQCDGPYYHGPSALKRSGVQSSSAGPGPTNYYLRIVPSLGGSGAANDPLLHVTGFVSNVSQNTPVFGQVVFTEWTSTAPLELAAQVQQDDGSWRDWATSRVGSCASSQDSGCDHKILQVSTSVPSNSNVRLELRVPVDASKYVGTLILFVYEATLFGAECFPDAANSGMCIQ